MLFHFFPIAKRSLGVRWDLPSLRLAALGALLLSTLRLLGAEPTEFEERRERMKLREEMSLQRYGTRDLGTVRRRAAEVGTQERRRQNERARSLFAQPLALPAWTSLGPSFKNAFNDTGLPAAPNESDSGMIFSIAVHPTDPKTLYVAPNGGGIWKSTDTGASWRALTDDVGPTIMGAVAVAPSDPNRVYAGSGAGNTASLDLSPVGYGFLSSTDGGNSWRITASSPADNFWALSVDPADPRVVLAAGNRGVQRTTDGGDTWTRVLNGTGSPWANSLSRSKTNPSLLFAATFRIGTQVSSGGECTFGSDPDVKGTIWKSTDGGRTWAEKSTGLPDDVGRSRIVVSVSPSDPSVVYSLLAKEPFDTKGCRTGLGVQLDAARSSDGGESWTALHIKTDVSGTQTDYALALSVDPSNPNVVYAGGLDTFKSTDGGANWRQITNWYVAPGLPTYMHADQQTQVHGLDGSIYFGNDGGIFRSTDGGATVTSLNRGLTTLQLYSLCQTPAAPDVVMGGAQDNGTGLRISGTEWKAVIGGDGFGCLIHPTNPQIMLGSVYNELIYLSNDGGASFSRSVRGLSDAGKETAGSFHTLLRRHPTDPNHIFTSSALKIWETSDGAANWSSPSGSIAGLVLIRDFSIDPSNGANLAIGANAAGIFLSTDGAKTWKKAGVTPVNFLAAVRFDRTDSKKLWASSTIPDKGKERLFASIDSGATWTAISRSGQPNGLPDLPVETVEQDLKDPNVLWAGTYIGVYRSSDRGQSWTRYGQGLPNVPVREIALTADGSKIRVATYGRGAWEALASASSANNPPTGSITEPGPGRTIDAAASIRFTGTGSDPDGDVLTYRWNFGDGTTAVGTQVEHAFAVAGSYNVVLTVSDPSLAVATASLTVQIRTPAVSGPELLLPVVLDISGAGGSHYTTELTLLSRASVTTNVLLLYTAAIGSGSGYASVSLAPGGSLIVPDVIAFLRGKNLPIPSDGSGQVGTLRASFAGAISPADVFIGGRTSTPGAGGSFGLFYPAAATSTSNAVIAGLQQNSAQRSNIALVNAGSDPITLRVQLFGALGEDLGTLPDQNLTGFGWVQLNTPLAGKALAGRALVTRISGSSPFTTYGVLNDAFTSDGSYIPPLFPGDTSGADRLVPIVLNVGGLGGSRYTTELTFANLTASPLELSLGYLSSIGQAASGQTTLTLAAGEQRIVSDAIAFLRGAGIAIPSDGSSVGGSLLVKAPAGTAASSLAVGARTFTAALSGPGTFGLFYPGLTLAESATDVAFINGLQQSGTQRSNLAVVNRGDGRDSITLRITFYGPDGAPLLPVSTVTLAPQQWMQLGQPLAGPGVSSGSARIERLSGASRFVAYGVLNDAANSDGSYIPMSR